MPTFINTQTKSLTDWSNYCGTIKDRTIDLFCTPQSDGNPANSVMRKQGDSVRAILAHCFAQKPPEPIRALGTRLSFSRVIEPTRAVIDTPNMNNVFVIDQKWLSNDYKDGRGSEGGFPVVVEGGCTIQSLNRRLANAGLALQTSGAGDGHRIAGCIATGTHGSAFRVGALHDTVLGIHLVIAPDKALFVQSKTSPVCTDEWSDWLTRHTGIPTTPCNDDDALNTALVALGSLGFVFNVVVEAVKLFRFKRKTLTRVWNDPVLWDAIRTLETSELHPENNERPHHFEVLFNPYPPSDDIGAWITLLWKTSADGIPPKYPFPVPPDTASDTMGLIGDLAQAFGGLIPDLTTLILRPVITSQLTSRLANSNGTEAFPGEVFGPTTLAPGRGASTEIVVNHAHIQQVMQILFAVLQEEADEGRHLLGAVALRFVPQSTAFLGMNIHPMNCFIELPSIHTENVLQVFAACWDALEAAQIPFTCHWGQLHGMTPERVARYFGKRAQSWKDTRTRLLDSTAQTVFAAPILDEVGLSST